MSFVEVRFPESISFKSVGGPEFSTNIISLKSGFEQRNVNWSNTRSSYNIANGIKTKAQLESLLQFFMARRGRAYGFRFKDWNDYSATDENIGIGDNSKTQFQLTKTYSNGNVDYVRTINKPVSETVTIYADDVEVESGISIDTTTGIITFDTAPAMDVIITADFEFDVPVRFDSDKLDLSLNSLNSGIVNEVKLVEIRI